VGDLAQETSLIDAIVDQIKAFVIPINGSRGFNGAEVVAGGVDTREVDARTMESRLHKGLYLTGEVWMWMGIVEALTSTLHG